MTCDYCAGDGEVDCTECDGEGCDECSESGQIECDECEGEGEVREDDE